jgi:hypothetical protein
MASNVNSDDYYAVLGVCRALFSLRVAGSGRKMSSLPCLRIDPPGARKTCLRRERPGEGGREGGRERRRGHRKRRACCEFSVHSRTSNLSPSLQI